MGEIYIAVHFPIIEHVYTVAAKCSLLTKGQSLRMIDMDDHVIANIHGTISQSITSTYGSVLTRMCASRA